MGFNSWIVIFLTITFFIVGVMVCYFIVIGDIFPRVWKEYLKEEYQIKNLRIYTIIAV